MFDIPEIPYLLLMKGDSATTIRFTAESYCNNSMSVTCYYNCHILTNILLPYKYIYVLRIQEEDVQTERISTCFEGYHIIGYVVITFPVLQNSTYILISRVYFLSIKLQHDKLSQIDHVGVCIIIVTNSTTLQILHNVLQILSVLLSSRRALGLENPEGHLMKVLALALALTS